MEGNIIRAVNFNNGEALDLQSLSEGLKGNRLERSELNKVLGGCFEWCDGECCFDDPFNCGECICHECSSECSYQGCYVY